MHGSGRLPIPLSTFVGREAEIVELTSLIGQARLVSLTGLGGSGKSRLALAVAQRVASSFPDGVWWVPLAHVTDPANVAEAVAEAMGLAETGRSPMAALLARLRTGRALLICDNCEHLGDAVAEVVEELLVDCPSLGVVATTQRRLGVAGEVTWVVPPLSTPAAPGADRDVSGYESVRLFVDRARSALPQFHLNDDNLATIRAVCQRLEGLPLAIELAAARVTVLSVQQIAARLDDALGVLVGGIRTAMPRHRSLRATMDWTFELLGEAERQLLAELSVFVGSFDLEAVEAIHVGAGPPLDVLTELVDRSLVAVIPAGQQVRYRLLEPVRQYAAEQLRARGGLEAARARHDRHVLRLAEREEASRAGEAPRARAVPVLGRIPRQRALEAVVPDPRPGPAPGEVTSTLAELRIQALGGARVYRGATLLESSAWTYAKPRELLYFLLSHAKSTKDQIGAALWPSASPARLRNSFHTTLHHLRRALGDPAWITYQNGRYAFNRSWPYSCDVEVLEAGLAQVQNTEPAGLAHLVAAAEVYQGDFLADLPGEQWIDARRAELRTAFEQVLLALGRRYARAGQFAQAVQTYERAITHDNLLEVAHRELIRCYAGMGERARALRHYNNLVTLLRDQLGIQPSTETRELYVALRNGAAPALPSPRKSPSTRYRTPPSSHRQARLVQANDQQWPSPG